jgi:hypothetical protein
MNRSYYSQKPKSGSFCPSLDRKTKCGTYIDYVTFKRKEILTPIPKTDDTLRCDAKVVMKRQITYDSVYMSCTE